MVAGPPTAPSGATTSLAGGPAGRAVGRRRQGSPPPAASQGAGPQPAAGPSLPSNRRHRQTHPHYRPRQRARAAGTGPTRILVMPVVSAYLAARPGHGGLLAAGTARIAIIHVFPRLKHPVA